MSSYEDRKEFDRWDDEEDSESEWERNGYCNEVDYWSERI